MMGFLIGYLVCLASLATVGFVVLCCIGKGTQGSYWRWMFNFN